MDVDEEVIIIFDVVDRGFRARVHGVLGPGGRRGKEQTQPGSNSLSHWRCPLTFLTFDLTHSLMHTKKHKYTHTLTPAPVSNSTALTTDGNHSPNTHAMLITIKSSQFHGSRRNVKSPTQKPLDNTLIVASKV